MRVLVACTALALVALGSGEAARAQADRATHTVVGDADVTWRAEGTQGAVAAGGRDAVAAGIEVLKAGGNAVDAAVATLLALAVTDSRLFCLGGEVPIIVYDAKREVVEVICGQGAAPRLATREHFDTPDGIPARGIESAAVPAALDACLTALDRYGSWTFSDAVRPTLAMLEASSLPWHGRLAATLNELCEAESAAAGDRSRGLRLVGDYFYRGPVARRIDAWSRENGGLIRYADLATHTTPIEDPVSVEYRGHTIYKCGAWTQGPCLLQTLQLLEGYDLSAWGHNSPDAIHVMVEAMKLALADRDVYYADPHFVDVPLDALLSPRYAASRRRLIDMDRASLEQRPGDPRAGGALLDPDRSRRGLGGADNDTTTCVVADRHGNVVAATPSGWFGVEAGDTGVWLGTRLQSFNTWVGHPNVIEPGKRPRITLSPTLVLREGRPVLAASVAGGDGQDQTMLQLVVNQIDFGVAPAESVVAPRFGTNHHVGSFRQRPAQLGSLLLYPETAAAIGDDLKGRGHRVEAARAPLWAPVVMRIDPQTGHIEAAGDPRAGRHAAAY